jgi:hypothetical protein
MLLVKTIALQTDRTNGGLWERFLLQHVADGAYAVLTDSLY